jgi:hypothetical protein
VQNAIVQKNGFFPGRKNLVFFFFSKLSISLKENFVRKHKQVYVFNYATPRVWIQQKNQQGSEKLHSGFFQHFVSKQQVFFSSSSPNGIENPVQTDG